MREWIITNNDDLKICMQEIKFVLEKTHRVKVQASSTRSKSNQQLGYYWAVILPAITKFINEEGHCNMTISKSDVNEIMNRKFFYTEVVVGNEMVRVVKSKSGATMEQMHKFIDDVIDWAINLGIPIEPPETGTIYD